MVQPLPVLEEFLPSQYALAATQLLYFLVSFVAIWLAGRLVLQRLLTRAFDAREMDAHARKPLKKLVSIATVFVAVAVAFGFADYGNFLTSLATIAAAATLAIGLAMQDVLKNLVAGVFIFTDKPFRIGDWIEWDGHEGVVEDISMRVSRVRTFDNELLTVPNSQLTAGVIKNPVARDSLRLKVVFGIGYDEDIDEATEIILEAATDHPDIMDEPAPSVRLDELGDSAVGLQSRIWIENPARSDFVRVRSEYAQDVKERLDDAGVDIPYPHRTLTGGIALADDAPTPDAAPVAGDE